MRGNNYETEDTTKNPDRGACGVTPCGLFFVRTECSRLCRGGSLHEAWRASCKGRQSHRQPSLKQKNIMYSCHFYAGSHGQFLRDKVKSARSSGLPVFISEFSICDASGNGAINYTEANKWKALIKKYQLSSCAWSLSNKAETASLLNSSTQETSGWKTSDLSATGKWVKTMMKGYD